MSSGVQAKSFRKFHMSLMVPDLDNGLSMNPTKFVLGFQKKQRL